MRSPTKSALIIQILAAFQLGMAANLLAADDTVQVSQGMSEQKHWICDYMRARNDVLYLRCEDRLSLLEDPLIMDEAEGSATQYIPIWSSPSDNRSAIRLIKSVLCNRGDNCHVEMRSLLGSNEYANR